MSLIDQEYDQFTIWIIWLLGLIIWNGCAGVESIWTEYRDYDMMLYIYIFNTDVTCESNYSNLELLWKIDLTLMTVAILFVRHLNSRN